MATEAVDTSLKLGHKITSVFCREAVYVGPVSGRLKNIAVGKNQIVEIWSAQNVIGFKGAGGHVAFTPLSNVVTITP